MKAADEKSLVLRAQRGDRAAVTALLKAHEGFLWQQAYRAVARSRGRMDVDDLMQEFRIKAVDCLRVFDPERGFRFLTYVGYALRQVARRMNPASGVIRVPAQERLDEPYRTQAQRAWTVCTISAVMARRLPDDASSPQADAQRQEGIELIRAGLALLPARERVILEGRMDDRTLDDIGRQIGLTRQRTHQIEQRAMERLRAFCTSRGVCEAA